MNQVVWPYQTGEIIVQNYNAVLTLSNLYQTADAIMVMENDELHKICTQLLGIKVWNVELTMYSYWYYGWVTCLCSRLCIFVRMSLLGFFLKCLAFNNVCVFFKKCFWQGRQKFFSCLFIHDWKEIYSDSISK